MKNKDKEMMVREKYDEKVAVVKRIEGDNQQKRSPKDRR